MPGSARARAGRRPFPTQVAGKANVIAFEAKLVQDGGFRVLGPGYGDKVRIIHHSRGKGPHLRIVGPETGAELLADENPTRSQHRLGVVVSEWSQASARSQIPSRC